MDIKYQDTYIIKLNYRKMNYISDVDIQVIEAKSILTLYCMFNVMTMINACCAYCWQYGASIQTIEGGGCHQFLVPLWGRQQLCRRL